MSKVIETPTKESVSDYPRPPRVEPVTKSIEVIFGLMTIAHTVNAHRVLETSHPPVYYIPAEDIEDGVLVPTGNWTTYCEFKGTASYFDVVVGDDRVVGGAWTYKNPRPGFEAIKDAVAFYCAPMDACLVGGEKATPQPGSFYGGWITSEIEGPFKGGPGTAGW